MENCLVTKLKGSVDNPLLPKLGEIIVQIKRTDFSATPWFRVKADAEQAPNPLVLTILTSGSFFTNQVDSLETGVTAKSFASKDSSNQYIHFPEGVDTISMSINNKYNITDIWGPEGARLSFDWAQWWSDDCIFSSMSPFGEYNEFNFERVRTNLSGLVVDVLRSQFIERQDNLMDFIPNVTQLYVIGDSNKFINEYAGKLYRPKMTLIRYNNYSNCSGALENFFTEVRKKYPTGSCQINCFAKQQITFGGVDQTKPFNLSWTATTMTCNGTTIEG